MVLDVLALFASKEAGTYVAKEVLLPLFQGSLEDYAKDYFKGWIAETVDFVSQEPVQKALGKGLKTFVELVEEELQFQGCSGAEIRDFYEIPLRQLMQDKDVKATLGLAFEPDCRRIDADVLALRWESLELRSLPEEFDWLQIGKQYVREVKGILRSSDELRDLLKLHNQEAIREGIETLVGIPADFDLRKYQETLREQYGNLKLESLDTTGYAYNDLKLWRMFIPQDVRTCQEFNPKVYEIPKEKLKELQQRGELDAETLETAQIEAYRKTYVEQPIQTVLEVVGRTEGVGQRSRAVADYAVVLGDPGSGKSTLLQYVALQWAEQPIRELKDLAQRPLPLLIELRKYARDRHDQKCSSIVEYLDKGDIACRLSQQRLHEVLTAGDAIALFDGIDEVFDPNLRDVVVTDIHRFTNNYPQVQTVVTSRWLGYKAQTLRDAGFQHYMLQDLTDEQIAEFIERWHDQTFPEGADKVRKRERLQKAIRESKAIRELAGNPLLLTMMAILNRNQELPRDRPELYNQASRVLLHQWDVERNLIEQRLDPVTIDYRDKQAMLRKVAYHMQSGEAGLAGNIISATDLEVILTEYLKSIDVGQSRDMARRMIQKLRERNFILCYLGADNYAFVHRTFLDFFAAWSFVWEFKEIQTLTFEELRDQTFGSHWQEESWQEVLRLIAGMIDSKFSNQLIEFLISQELDKKMFLRAFGTTDYLEPEGLINLLLAADCMSELGKGKLDSANRKQLLKKLKREIEYPKFNLAWQSARALLERIAFNYPEELPWLKRIAEDSRVFDEYTGQPILDFRKYNVSAEAVSAIAKYFHNQPDILPWIKSQIQSKDHFAPQAAISAIAEHYSHLPETLGWLQNHADDDEEIAGVAYVAIARCYDEHPGVLDWLMAQAESSDWYVMRSEALHAIAKHFSDNLRAFKFIKDRCEKESDYAVQATLAELIEKYLVHHAQALEAILKITNVAFKNIDLLKKEDDSFAYPNRFLDLHKVLEIYIRQSGAGPRSIELLNRVATEDPSLELRIWASKQFKVINAKDRALKN